MTTASEISAAHGNERETWIKICEDKLAQARDDSADVFKELLER